MSLTFLPKCLRQVTQSFSLILSSIIVIDLRSPWQNDWWKDIGLTDAENKDGGLGGGESHDKTWHDMLNLLKLIQLFLWKHDTKGLEYNIGDADLCSGISALVLKFTFYRTAVVFHKQYSPFPWITLQSFCTKLSFPYAASLCFVKTIVETH